MCCHPDPHSCMAKIYMSTCRNLLLLPPLCRYTGCHTSRCGLASTSPSPENGTYACGGVIRQSQCARARAESLPASHNIWKRKEKKKKTTKSRQALRIQSGPSVVHKNYFLPKALLRKKQALLFFTKTIFCPKLCSERNRPFFRAIAPAASPGRRWGVDSQVMSQDVKPRGGPNKTVSLQQSCSKPAQRLQLGTRPAGWLLVVVFLGGQRHLHPPPPLPLPRARSCQPPSHQWPWLLHSF